MKLRLSTEPGHRHDGRMGPERNSAGNHAYSFGRFHEPDTLDELISLVGEATRLRVVASRHCFNDIGDTDPVAGDLVSLRRLQLSMRSTPKACGPGLCCRFVR